MKYLIWITVFVLLIVGIVLTIALYFNKKARKILPQILLIYIIFSLIAIITAILYSSGGNTDSYSIGNYRHTLEDDKHNHQLVKNRHIIDKHLSKLSTRVLGTIKTPIYVIEKFLSDEECDELVASNEGKYKKSPLTREIKDFRTSETSFFDYKHEIQTKVDSKILETMKSSKLFAEKSQMQHYNVGNEFKHHYDWFHPTLDKGWYDKGQRTWTFMIYLNTPEEGGETDFSELGEKIKAVKGTAVIWGNMLADNTEDKDVKHAGLPIIKGEKYIITKWFKKEHNRF